MDHPHVHHGQARRAGWAGRAGQSRSTETCVRCLPRRGATCLVVVSGTWDLAPMPPSHSYEHSSDVLCPADGHPLLENRGREGTESSPLQRSTGTTSVALHSPMGPRQCHLLVANAASPVAHAYCPNTDKGRNFITFYNPQSPSHS